MDISTLPCNRHEVEHVRKFIVYAKSTVNDAWIYPPANDHRYMVALALYSKCITVAEATLALLDAGFSDEAFGVTRTLVDIFITLHYISNKDTEHRARRYAEFAAKDSEVWIEVAKTYWPQHVQPMEKNLRIIAATYRSPHSWSGHTVKDMALEPDTVEVDETTGRPTVHDFAYRVIYRWTSPYVHPTIGALRNHLVQAGRDNFVVRSGRGQDMRHLTIFNVASYLVNTMICFYRCMGDPQPNKLSNWAAALVAHIARHHQ
ncbi:MAG: DUF5677 domain-containing protein [Acidobacteriota bacterium]|nr:DUF5677 domain-containing protein [Acidobacteriota bacterium]